MKANKELWKRYLKDKIQSVSNVLSVPAFYFLTKHASLKKVKYIKKINASHRKLLRHLQILEAEYRYYTYDFPMLLASSSRTKMAFMHMFKAGYCSNSITLNGLPTLTMLIRRRSPFVTYFRRMSVTSWGHSVPFSGTMSANSTNIA